ncbi:hypothetical protein LXA47_31375 [Massilia sp. P8910]|uniref:hypothetical protein n=1 Tax=Massilia antarctica TaxID=2765360 RepID=UPI001E36B33F|nr:hypothetical protein [Massilia antarctica]MCE3608073.1 hypothetical protein [Massilia antarctica]
MMGDLAHDLFAKLDAIPQLAGRVGLSVGGHKADPGMASAPLPLAWALFKSTVNIDERLAGSATSSSINHVYRVFLVTAYEDQAGLIAETYPLVEACIKSIRGTTAPSGTKWRFENVELTQINPDRLFHEISFSINAHL